MRLKKKLKTPLTWLSAGLFFWGLALFSERQTQGFRLYLILSNLPNDSRWETSPLTPEEKNQVDALLDQPFTFLGSGGWCYAFLGQDQKTVLKFYKHSHLQLQNIVKNFSIRSLLLKSDPLPENIPYFQEFNFNSCMLLWKRARKRSGLLYIHLNKTHGVHKSITLIDNIGVHHRVDLDRTEFVLQKKAQLLIPHLNDLLKEKKIEEAQRKIDDMLACLFELYRKGIRDYDQSFRQNYGFIEEGAIALDLSSFVYDESIKDPHFYAQEIRFKTKRLAHWLKKYQPALFAYYDEKLQELLKSVESNQK